MSQERRDAAPAFAGQPLPYRRRQIAHRGIRANAPTRTALGTRLSVIRCAPSIYERQRQWHIDVGFRTFIPYANLAAVYALEGKMEEAKAPFAEARRLNPSWTVKWAIAHAPNIPVLFEGLRKAGVPEE